MDHQRKLIRDAVTKLLSEAGTAAERRVFASRSAALIPKDLPAILVYAKNERAEISNQAPREYKRTLSLSIECVSIAYREEELDDKLDCFAYQVEKALFIDETFGGVASDAVLTDTEIEILTDGEQPIGAVKIGVEITYYQRIPSDESSDDLDDFLKMGTKVDLPEADGTFENNDLVDVPQT